MGAQIDNPTCKAAAQAFTLRHVTVGSNVGFELTELLAREAVILDNGRYDEWLNLIGRNVRYCCSAALLRVASDAPSCTDEESCEHSYEVLATYIKSLTATPAASRPAPLRRLVTNVFICPGVDPKHFVVTSYLVLAAMTGPIVASPMIIIERRDIFRKCAFSYQLERRELGPHALNEALRARIGII
jgi:hypothetical protein